ncbi:MAG: adenylate/guanylate cyclase domain-containing protein [Candidatus Dormiibacterota bacterium]
MVGDGPIDLVYASGVRGGNLDVVWEHPPIERYLRRLASFSRLILCNPRGTGSSDPVRLGAATFEEAAMDFRWVLDAAESERAAFLATEGGGWTAMLFAATFPERTRALALVNCFATFRRHHDYPSGFPTQAAEQFAAAFVAGWGSGEHLRMLAPELADDQRFRAWFGRLERLSMNPASVESYVQDGLKNVDLRGILSTVKAPTLIISHADMSYIRPGHSRYLADHIQDARYVERPGFWGIPWLHDVEWTLDEVQAFFTGTRGAPDLDDRVLATVLFTDIVGSTQHAADMGDRQWHRLLDEHDTVTLREIERFRGRLVKSTGDGCLATFDGPARAIRCALALTDAVRQLGIEVRTGLHTGEIEQRGQDVGGIAVHIAERVMGEAGAGEVVVSGAVPPLVAGSGIDFDDLGTRALKGVPGEWKLYSAKK